MSIQNLTILGSTGSIGINTLNVVTRHPERFRIFALSGHIQINKLAEQCIIHQPYYAVVNNECDAKQLRALLSVHQLKTEVLHGTQALIDIAQDSQTDMVMAAIVGAAGLLPTLAAAQAGKKILLANKETLVISGNLFMQTAAAHDAQVLPVDSEHNAIYQVLPETFRNHNHNKNLCDFGIESLILTASGGPFLNADLNQFDHITPEQAIQHPNWSMGKKISIDSATMMNKGLELIEAHWLFNCPPQQLEVIVHPQSIIHSMVRYNDGSVLAQMGNPDMRTPIAYCLGLPERIQSGVTPLDFTQLSTLNFQKADPQRFPCLQLAYDAMNRGGVAPCILNAANEIAVAAFLNHRIQFTDISRVVAYCLEQNPVADHHSIDGLLAQDTATRIHANAFIQKWLS